MVSSCFFDQVSDAASNKLRTQAVTSIDLQLGVFGKDTIEDVCYVFLMSFGLLRLGDHHLCHQQGSKLQAAGSQSFPCLFDRGRDRGRCA